MARPCHVAEFSKGLYVWGWFVSLNCLQIQVVRFEKKYFFLSENIVLAKNKFKNLRTQVKFSQKTHIARIFKGFMCMKLNFMV